MLLDNHGFSSIGGLSDACGSGGFGTRYRYRKDRQLQGDLVEVDFVANAVSLGAVAVRVRTLEELKSGLAEARAAKRTTVTAIEVDGDVRVPGYESWWDVPIAEVSEMDSVRDARRRYDTNIERERNYF